MHYTALPAETGPTRAPDRMSIWPVEGGRYGIDAHYLGATGTARAEGQVQRLQSVGLQASVRTDDDGTVLRLGPLAHPAGLDGARGVHRSPARIGRLSACGLRG